MSEQNKRQTPRPIKELKYSQPDKKKFEIKHHILTPYGRWGNWLEFIWRF